jgi:hypothetical protein
MFFLLFFLFFLINLCIVILGIQYKIDTDSYNHNHLIMKNIRGALFVGGDTYTVDANGELCLTNISGLYKRDINGEYIKQN